MTDASDGSYGPVTEVWNHLWSAIDQSVDELRALEPKSRLRVEEIGQALAQARTDFVLKGESFGAAVDSIAEIVLKDPWFRHAAEIEIARLGISRSDDALKRFVRLRPVVTSRPVPDRAKRYIREVIDSFMFGFDAPCVALCRAACEQVLREKLVAEKVYTEPQLKRERPTAGTLLARAKQAGLLSRSRRAAERLVEKGDMVMHNFIFEERILEQQALDSIAELAEVLAEALE